MTVEEILSSLGVTPDPAKASAIAEWNTKLTASQTEAQQKIADATKQLQDAQALQRVIDENIRTAGLTETNLAQLQANNAALTAALAARDAAIETIKKQGFTGLNIPDLPKINEPAPKDAGKELTDLITRGFNQMGQTLNEMNRYQRVFGKALPEDPATIADRAARSNLSVHAYMEQTYGIAGEEQKQAQAAEQKKLDDYSAKKIEEYKAAHPATTGHPELNPGVPSNYPNIPKPRESQSVREFSALPTRQKIADAMQRAVKDVSARQSA